MDRPCRQAVVHIDLDLEHLLLGIQSEARKDDHHSVDMAGFDRDVVQKVDLLRLEEPELVVRVVLPQLSYVPDLPPSFVLSILCGFP